MEQFDCVPKMPEEYKGKVGKSCGYTLSSPRAYTKQEIEWMLNLKEQGYKVSQIAESVDRTEVSVQIKLKRIGKSENTYNKEHIEYKYQLNTEFFNIIKPKSVLDVYCGENRFWHTYNENQLADTVDKICVTENDINRDIIGINFNEDALKFISRMYVEGNKFDLIDLDPFGSAYDCFDLAIKMAKKGIIITFGELGHKRWKRLDYVSTHYGIESLEDFTLENMVEHVKAIGRRNKKNLTPVLVGEWRNIGRVYFEIQPFKVVEQWEKKEDK